MLQAAREEARPLGSDAAVPLPLANGGSLAVALAFLHARVALDLPKVKNETVDEHSQSNIAWM